MKKKSNDGNYCAMDKFLFPECNTDWDKPVEQLLQLAGCSSCSTDLSQSVCSWNIN